MGNPMLEVELSGQSEVAKTFFRPKNYVDSI